jgi:hypothetical protein
VRANALSAARFVPLSTVDARVSDAVLEVLEDAGVAAYVEPTLGEVGPYRDVRGHGSPSQSLYVDAAQREVAAMLLQVELPGLLAELDAPPARHADEDAAFAAIVAGFHLDPASPDAHRPSADQVHLPAPDDDEQSVSVGRPRAAVPDEDEHYVPPPPPPLPRLHGAALWGALALAAAVLLLLVLPLFRVVSDGQLVVGILLAAGGVGTLLWQMRDAPPTDSGPDDGAVV